MDTKKTSSRGGYLSLQCPNTDAEGGWCSTSKGVTMVDLKGRHDQRKWSVSLNTTKDEYIAAKNKESKYFSSNEEYDLEELYC